VVHDAAVAPQDGVTNTHVPAAWQVVRDLARHRWAMRVLLIAAFAAASHQYDWWWLRVLTVDTLLRISTLLGVHMSQLSPDTILVAGVPAKFVISCTMIDVFAGAIPLLWRIPDSWSANLLRLAGAFGGIFLFNIVRLELGFVAMTRGVPWWLAHECVAGVAYFAVLQFIVRQRAWDWPAPSTPVAA
jgi:hypothetical protein